MRIVTLLLALLLLGHGAASAEPISLRIRGTVDSLFETVNALPGTLEAGSEFEVELTFEREAAVLTPSPDANLDMYNLEDYSAAGSIGGHVLRPQEPDLYGGLRSSGIWVAGGGGGGPDQLTFTIPISSPSTFLIPLPYSTLKLVLVNEDGAALGDTAGFPTLLDMGLFSEGRFEFDATTMAVNSNAFYRVSGTIHSIEVMSVPEPSAMLAMAIGAGAFAVFVRRFSVSNRQTAPDVC